MSREGGLQVGKEKITGGFSVKAENADLKARVEALERRLGATVIAVKTE